MKRKNGFPIRVEKNGVTFPIYRVRSGNGYVSYVISYRENGAPKRLGFPTVGEARTAAKKAAKDIAAGNAKSVQLTPENGHSFLRASERLKPFGVHIEVAAVDYAEGPFRGRQDLPFRFGQGGFGGFGGENAGCCRGTGPQRQRIGTDVGGFDLKPIVKVGGIVVGYLRETGDRIELLAPGGKLLGIYLKGPDQTIRPGGGGFVGCGNQLYSLLED